MQLTLTTLLATALLSLSGLATASPLLQTRQTTEPPARYYLKTKVDNGKHVDTGTNKTDLWVFSYHTGAGLGAAGLSPNKTDAWEGYLNGTQQLFTYPENEIGPWPLSFSSLNLYERWLEADISIASINEAQGFFFNSSGLQYNQSSGGWLACDWSLQSPQLYNVVYGGGPYPSSCSKVHLLPVAV
ncbi:hypothetical protein PV08_08655 [Exophiala spinifera]|uniref:DUF7907 domain-containing protein n=1 Tax=Exophiala spinifera TaxID=91928 RepID=A0A0D1ZKX7_9EURO|nr:uncharacterized protein PV08_08655 [Exophiala spinifera]KIW13467.1 hypothetical protein PV08_08655 [Exophiala spinifera]